MKLKNSTIFEIADLFKRQGGIALPCLFCAPLILYNMTIKFNAGRRKGQKNGYKHI